MERKSSPESTSRSSLKLLSIITLISAFSQVALGGYVRSSESGLGCPDWPLCHGQLIPPMEFHTLIEYSHRLNASLLMLFVIGLFVVSWVRYKDEKSVFILSGSAVGLVLSVAILGGITVLTELEWWVRLIHLTLAELLIGTIVGVVWLAFSPKVLDSATLRPIYTYKWKPKLWFIAIGLLLLIISGSYMVGTGAGSACASWPLCRGELFPQGSTYAIHMGHRYIAALMLIIAGYIGWSFIKKDSEIPGLKRASMGLIHSMLLQIIIGAVLVWSGFNPALKTIHLALATLIWIAAIYLISCVLQNNSRYSRA